MMKRSLLGLLAFAFATTPAFAVTVETVRSPGGITAWLVEDHSQKVISLDFSVRGGAANKPADKAGLSGLVDGSVD